MRGHPRHNTRPYIRLPPGFLAMNAWMTSQLIKALIRKLRGLLMCLAYFWTCFPWVFIQQGTGKRTVD